MSSAFNAMFVFKQSQGKNLVCMGCLLLENLFLASHRRSAGDVG